MVEISGTFIYYLVAAVTDEITRAIKLQKLKFSVRP